MPRIDRHSFSSRSLSWESNASTSAAAPAPFLRFQKWTSSCFQGDGTGCPCSLLTRMNCETRKKKKKKIEAVDHEVVTSMTVNDEMPSRLPEISAPATVTAQRMPIVLVCTNAENPTKEDPKFVWADKYRPIDLRHFICHRQAAQQLLLSVSSGQSSHCILEGPPGLGKRTLARASLREDFGIHEIETREEVREFTVEKGPVSTIQMNVQVSSKHIEIDLSILNGYAVLVVEELIKEAHRLFNHEDKNNKQVIILHGAGILSMDDQLRIRICLEDYKGHYKVYFCSSGVSKLQEIEALCAVIKILPPSKEEIIQSLEFIAHCEGIELPPSLADKIANKSKHSIQQAIRSFEATWQLNYPFKEDQIIMTGWEEELASIANCIIDERSPKQLYTIREKLKTFMDHNVSPEFIYESLMEELNKLLSHPFQAIITKLGQDGGLIDQDLKITQDKFEGGSDEEAMKRIGVPFSKTEPVKRNAVLFLKIEECIAKFMSIYKILSQKEQQKTETNCTRLNRLSCL